MAKRNVATNYKVPRKVTRKSLENSAFYYLRRYSSSIENLRRILLNEPNVLPNTMEQTSPRGSFG